MAESFTLDTSGHVVIDGVRVGWEAGTAPFHIDPFAQGYIEAALRWWLENGGLIEMARAGLTPAEALAFYRLAPATLARILQDCEAALSTKLWGDSSGDGRLFWSERGAEAFSGFFGGQQDGLRALFPPLTFRLGDDGLIYFGEGAHG